MDAGRRRLHRDVQPPTSGRRARTRAAGDDPGCVLFGYLSLAQARESNSRASAKRIRLEFKQGKGHRLMSTIEHDFETRQTVRIPITGAHLAGDLVVPEGAHGVVVFAHGSGSSRFSSRNRFVADRLREAKLGTLLIDLLTAAEETVDLRTSELRFDIELLARRVLAAVDPLHGVDRPRQLQVQPRRGRAVVRRDRLAEPRDDRELGLIDRVERRPPPQQEQ